MLKILKKIILKIYTIYNSVVEIVEMEEKTISLFPYPYKSYNFFVSCKARS